MNTRRWLSLISADNDRPITPPSRSRTRLTWQTARRGRAKVSSALAAHVRSGSPASRLWPAAAAIRLDLGLRPQPCWPARAVPLAKCAGDVASSLIDAQL